MLHQSVASLQTSPRSVGAAVAFRPACTAAATPWQHHNFSKEQVRQANASRAAAAAPGCCSPASQRRSAGRYRLAPLAAIRGVESFDGTFELTEEQSGTLNELLHSELFSLQVVRDCQLPEGAAVAFTGVTFMPRPWTPTETKGMPAEIEEQFYGKPEQYTFINVPPVFMFQAKIFMPPRLCAVYKRV